VGIASIKHLVGSLLASNSRALVRSTPKDPRSPPQRNFTDISIISGYFDNLKDKGPLTEKDKATPVDDLEDGSVATLNKKHRGSSKRKKCLPFSSNELFLKLAKDTPFSEAMDSAEKVLVGRVRGRHYSVEQLQKWMMEF